MANVNVTYDDLRNQASQLRNGQKAIEDQLSQLKSQIDNLVSSGYVTDKSSKAFDSTYSEFNSRCDADGPGHRRHGRVPRERGEHARVDRRAARVQHRLRPALNGGGRRLRTSATPLAAVAAHTSNND
ncbi:WXG100 family type VII secretion target [Curtobacterium flaccumfaciens]|nr:WXG100 family type VII secretion target [Curtobacterium flaccumfaciens]